MSRKTVIPPKPPPPSEIGLAASNKMLPPCLPSLPRQLHSTPLTPRAVHYILAAGVVSSMGLHAIESQSVSLGWTLRCEPLLPSCSNPENEVSDSPETGNPVAEMASTVTDHGR